MRMDKTPQLVGKKDTTETSRPWMSPHSPQKFHNLDKEDCFYSRMDDPTPFVENGLPPLLVTITTSQLNAGQIKVTYKPFSPP